MIKGKTLKDFLFIVSLISIHYNDLYVRGVKCSASEYKRVHKEYSKLYWLMVKEWSQGLGKP